MATKETPKYQPAGILEDTAGVLSKAPNAAERMYTTIGVGGAVLYDALNNVKQYLMGGVRQPDQIERNIEAYKKVRPEYRNAQGVPQKSPVIAKPTVTPQVVAPALGAPPAMPIVPNGIPITTVAPQQAQAPSPYSKFKDEYDYANSLSDKDFKAFIDANQDNPNLVGMGYIEGSEKGKPEKGNPRGKFQRIIDRPQPKDYTAEELKSIVPLAQLGVEKRKNELTAEGHGLTREALAEDRKEKNLIAREKIEAKKETDTLSKKTAQTKTFLDSMEAFADVVPDFKTGESKKDYTAFLLATDAVSPEQVPAEVKGITQRAKKQFNAWASDQIAKNKKFKDTPELRMELLEAYLKGKIYLPKQAE